MKTWLPILLIAVLLLVTAGFAVAQRPAKIPQIGYLNVQAWEGARHQSELSDRAYYRSLVMLRAEYYYQRADWGRDVVERFGGNGGSSQRGLSLSAFKS